MEERKDLRPVDEGDPGITRILRDAYAPPAESKYWDGLESRIMAYIAEHSRVTGIPVNWWSDLASWAAPGLAAAGLLFVAAGLLWSRQNDEDMRVSYEAVVETVPTDVLPGAVQVVTARPDGSQREATFRYVMSH
ncbi:MAG: hypothetical protein ACREMS_13760 [Gemmatimonadaceae bacterium]